jgi:hypothetical protein
MTTNRFVGIILVLAGLLVFGSTGCAQQGIQKQSSEGTITIKGKIDYMKPLGGYYLNGEDPREGYMIVNRNPKLLEELFKNGKTINVEGHFTGSADHLFIEKIDGKPYKGE